MDYREFEGSMEESAPSDLLPSTLQSLWWDKKGNWDRAHRIIQDENGSSAAWIHAHLHRKKEDERNAGYWYKRAGKDFPQMGFEEEWVTIVKQLLEKSQSA